MSKMAWRHIDERDVSASFGLASDEVMVQSHTRPGYAYPATIKLYTYRDYCALCGRFQDLAAEIDLEACQLAGYQYGRRLTGGGAIIMGSSQLGICLSAPASSFQWNHVRELYSLFSTPIVRALADFGISAGFRAKNDLEVGGRKIAGLGIHISPDGGIQFHASVLLDLDIPQMLRVLKIPVQKFSDKKMIASVEQRMTHIRRESGMEVSMDQLKLSILNAYRNAFGVSFETAPFSSEEKSLIQALAKQKYESDAWLFQNSPQLDMDGMSLKKTAAGLLRTYIAMKGENIKRILMTGDFMEVPEAFAMIEAQLKWTPLDKDKIAVVVTNAFRDHSPLQHPYAIKPEEVVEAIWLAAQRAFAANKYTYQGSCYYPKENIDA